MTDAYAISATRRVMARPMGTLTRMLTVMERATDNALRATSLGMGTVAT